MYIYLILRGGAGAKIAQLGERMTEDHKVRCSIHLLGAFFYFIIIIWEITHSILNALLFLDYFCYNYMIQCCCY